MNFPLEKFNPFEIGLHPINKKDWLSLNVFDSAHIKNKHRLIKESLQDVYFVSENYKQEILDLALAIKDDLIKQESGLHERLNLSLQETGIDSILDNALLVLSLMVEDDLVILSPKHDAFKMIGAAVFSPSGWDLKTKQLLDIDAIHSPVPNYNSLLSERLKKLLKNLPPSKPFERFNWSLYQKSDLYQPSKIKQSNVLTLNSNEDIESLSLRVERQTLYKPDYSDLIIFSIKVTNFPLVEVTSNKLRAKNFYLALENLSNEMIEYKGLLPGIGMLKNYLKLY
ncbi:MAG: heme-dependent oxidative N-demethylase subunit alpha family protein [Gammaproteobacteria bacterium]